MSPIANRDRRARSTAGTSPGKARRVSPRRRTPFSRLALEQLESRHLLFAVTVADAYANPPPLTLRVDFDQPVAVATLQAADLMIDGTLAATAVAPVDADTVTFTLPALAPGAHTLTIAQNAINDMANVGIDPFSTSITIAANPQYRIKYQPYLQPGNAPLANFPGGQLDRVDILWETQAGTGGTADTFQVQYRPAGSTTWQAAQLNQNINTGVGGRIVWSASVTGLNWNSTYEYRVRQRQASVIIDEFQNTFQTRLRAGDTTPFTFAAYGDSAATPPTGFRQVQSRINMMNPAFSVLLGDNIYDVGSHAEADARFDPIANPEAAVWQARHIDYLGLGNHDVGTGNGLPSEQLYSVPIPDAGVTSSVEPPASERPEHNFSWDYGDVHFVTFDTNSYLSPARLAGQLDWVVADLNASTARWKIVYGHHPVAGVPDKPESPSDNYYQQVVSRLFGAGVDLFMTGHSHTYAWTYPLTGQVGRPATFVNNGSANNFIAGDGLPQLVSGLGGREIRGGSFAQFPFVAAGWTSETTPIPQLGFSLIEVDQGELTVKYVSAATGNPLGEFVIQKPVPPGTGPHILNNGPGDASVNVGVDGYGSFGRAVSGSATDANYDPLGPIAAAGTTFESGVALGFSSGQRTFLSTGINTGATLPNPQVTGNAQFGTSDFTIGDLRFHLTQQLSSLSGTGGARVGSQLTQAYTITNIGVQSSTFDLVRYFDGDLDFDLNRTDGGGRLVVGNNEILFETDTATGTATSATFIGIMARSGFTPAINRYEADSYFGLLDRISLGNALDNTIFGDGADADQFVDVGQGYDITLGLRNVFSLAPGQSSQYVTTTLFGTGAPEDVVPVEPPPPPPPVPFRASGAVFNDLSGDGVRDPGEPGLADAIVYVDLNNDGRFALGEPAQSTNSSGQFSFSLPDGTYIIRQAELAGWQLTTPLSGFYAVVAVAEQSVSDLLFGNFSTLDWGDAPAPYPTLAANNGPSHSILSGLSLGGGLDGETNGVPGLRADGDDLASLDDDDGISFVTSMSPGRTATIDVSISNGGRAAGMLHAWIDFNVDGDWDDAGEHVFANQRVAGGSNRLSFAVPAAAKLGNTYARFRYGYGNNVSYTGRMLGGEVEDYVVSIVGSKPIGNSDTFTVLKNSVANTLDVLFNDAASAQGPITIIGLTAGNHGGRVVLNPINKTLLYTPPADFTGTETFTYTITDFRGGVVTTSVTVVVEDLVVPALAIDDSFSVLFGSQTFFDVLANDQAGTGGVVSLTAPITSVRGGTVDVMRSTQTIRYRAPQGYVGLDQFDYTIRDANGTVSQALVTVHVGADTANDDVRISFVVTDASGAEIDEVLVGETFQVRAYVTDLRLAPTTPGVYAAYLDLLYDQALVELNGAANTFGFDVTFSSEFNNFQQGAATAPGIVDEIGASRTTPPTGLGPTEVFRLSFTAEDVGTAVFTGDPADLAILHDVLLYDPAGKVAIDKVTYGVATVDVIAPQSPQVTASLLRNVLQPNDVNADGSVTPLDALMVVNELNAKGSHAAATTLQAEPSSSSTVTSRVASFFDVSGDNMVTPLDALFIINHLNQQRVGGEGEGESAVAAETATIPLALATTDTSSTRSALTGYVAPERYVPGGSVGTYPLSSAAAGYVTPDFLSGSLGSDDDDELADLISVIASDVDEVWSN